MASLALAFRELERDQDRWGSGVTGAAGDVGNITGSRLIEKIPWV